MAKSKSWNIDDLERKGYRTDDKGNYIPSIANSLGYTKHIKIPESTIITPIQIKLKKTKRPKAKIVKRIPTLKPTETTNTIVFIKPLSVNQAWQGKRFKTPKYVKYEQELLASLPPMIIPPPPYEIYFKFGFSSSLSDFDNPLKPTIDVLSKKYGFNDKLIKRGVIDIEDVDKGKEYIEFNIKTLV